MPEAENDGPVRDTPHDGLTPERFAEVVAERDRLQSELDMRANESIGSWLNVVSTESRILGEMQKTLSWRVTKPLRLIRKVQVKVSELGLARFSQLAVADLRRRFQGSRR